MQKDINPIQIIKLPIKAGLVEDLSRDWVAVTTAVTGSTAMKTVRVPAIRGDGDVDDGSGILAGAVIVGDDGTISLRLDKTKLDINDSGELTLSSELKTYYDGLGTHIRQRTDEEGKPIHGQSEIDVVGGNGIVVNETGVTVKQGEGIRVDANGVAIRVGEGIYVDEAGDVGVIGGSGIVVDEDGVSVAAGTGLSIDEDGNLEVDYTDDMSTPRPNKMWSAQVTKAYVDMHQDITGVFSGHMDEVDLTSGTATLVFQADVENNTELNDSGTIVYVGTENHCQSCTVSASLDIKFPNYDENCLFVEMFVNGRKFYVDSTLPSVTLEYRSVYNAETISDPIPVSVVVDAVDEDDFPEMKCSCTLVVSVN